MSVFKSPDYKHFLKAQIEEHQGEYAYKSRLAEAAGCQRSFLSQVLNSHVHLTPDHGLGMARFWSLKSHETEYFMELVNLARAATPALQKHIREKLSRLKAEAENLAKRFEQKELQQSEAELVYYSSWMYAAVHVGVSIPELQSAQSLAAKLHLPHDVVITVLHALEALGLVEKKGSRLWVQTQKLLHLGKSSYMMGAHHNNWRQKAVLSAFGQREEDLHYTAVCSLSLDDFKKLRQMTFQYIDDSRKLIGPSKEEELVVMNCDLFVL